jgi:hypothetical protein
VEKVVPKHSSRRPVAQVAPLRTLVPVLERTERRDADEPVAEIETEAFQSEQVVPADEVESVDEAMWDGFDGLPEQVEPDRSDELLEPDSPVEPLASVEPPEPVEPPKPVASAKRKKPSKKPKPVPPVEDDEPTGTDAGNSIYTPKSYKKSPKQKKHTT